MRLSPLVIGLLAVAGPAMSGTLTLAPSEIAEWKAVYGRVEARDTVPARARIGGTVAVLSVNEGDLVKAGQKIAVVQDEKIAFQIAALAAQLRALNSQLSTAQAELERGNTLVAKGIVTPQRVDQLRTEADVISNQIASVEAQKSLTEEQQKEGDVLAPVNGRVLTVPVTQGAVIMGGEPVATIGGGGFFLRLAIAERHAQALKQGAVIKISTNGHNETGTLVKIYPEIDNGRVIADVEVGRLDTDFVNARVLVEVPVGYRSALLVPKTAIRTRFGVDFVTVQSKDSAMERAVILGETIDKDKSEYVEVLTGLEAGDIVVTP